jgi:hypothetical protein
MESTDIGLTPHSEDQALLVESTRKAWTRKACLDDRSSVRLTSASPLLLSVAPSAHPHSSAITFRLTAASPVLASATATLPAVRASIGCTAVTSSSPNSASRRSFPSCGADFEPRELKRKPAGDCYSSETVALGKPPCVQPQSVTGGRLGFLAYADKGSGGKYREDVAAVATRWRLR